MNSSDGTERVLCKHCGVEIGFFNNFWRTDSGYATCKTLGTGKHEPKPTPSTEPSELVPLPWEPGLTDEIVAIAEKHALIDTGTKASWMATALALSMKLEEVMLKPQPDSSIPDEIAKNCNCWHVRKHPGRRFAGDHLPDCPARDSSSISTEQACAFLMRAERAETELASLRASVGEKPEDAYVRGFDAGYERARAQSKGCASLATRCYVAPPTLPGEEK